MYYVYSCLYHVQKNTINQKEWLVATKLKEHSRTLEKPLPEAGPEGVPLLQLRVWEGEGVEAEGEGGGHGESGQLFCFLYINNQWDSWFASVIGGRFDQSQRTAWIIGILLASG